MPAAHLDGQVRACGAVTTVVGQTTTFINKLLWAVEGDPNSHGGGGLIPSGRTVFIEGKPVIVNAPDDADADGLCPIFDGAHCNPATAQGDKFTFAYGSGGAGGGGIPNEDEGLSTELREDGSAERREDGDWELLE